MMKWKLLILVVTGCFIFAACQPEPKLSRNQIPLIKQSVVAFENVIKWREQSLLDSILSQDADRQFMNIDSILAFIETDTVGQFSGFAPKSIVFRGDAARCDSYIQGEKGQGKPVTITLKLENDSLWLIKRLELQSGSILPSVPAADNDSLKGE